MNTQSGTVRAATPADVPAMLALAEERRAHYAPYQPIFWRPAPNAAELQGPYFQELVAEAGAVQVVVVGARFSIASEWWVRTI
jgi:hypothetical protein